VISLAGVAGRSTIVVLRRKVDVHIDEVVGEMLGEGVLGLLVAAVRSEGLEILQ
jgi:hypothetical protein